MRPSWIALILLLSVLPPVRALEPSIWSGLKVEVQIVPGRIRINGVPVSAIRFVGEDAQKIEPRWLSMKQPLPVRSLTTESWRLHAVLEHAVSEVLQIRTNGEVPEAIWSSMPLSDSVASAPAAVRLLPNGCQAGRTIEGPQGDDHFLQHSAICRGRPDRILRDLTESVRRRGYQVTWTGAQGLQATTTRSSLAISVLPAAMQAGASHSVVVILGHDLPGARE